MPKLEMMLLVLLILPLCYIDAGLLEPWVLEEKEIIQRWIDRNCDSPNFQAWAMCCLESRCGTGGCCSQEVCDCNGPQSKECNCPP
uniref:Conotoxin Im20.2 n=1 Tax=Conus imperialis TaxID=35631 RepID=F5C3U3_CONIM|nr:conotoxin Im20.2 [Conus imperialis]